MRLIVTRSPSISDVSIALTKGPHGRDARRSKFQRKMKKAGRSRSYHGRLYEGEKRPSSYFRKLVSLYRKSACLWKKDGPHYLDREERRAAYRAIREAMALPGVTLVEIVLKIREMRRLYVRELKRILEAETNGYCYRPVLSWFYDLHRFLYPYLDYHETTELHNLGKTIDEFDEPERREDVETSRTDCSTTYVEESSSCNRCRTSSGSSFCSIGTQEKSNRFESTMDAGAIGRRNDPSNSFERCKTSNDPASSTENYLNTELDRFEVFSKAIARCLRKMEKTCALKAQAEIQRILMDLSVESNTRKNGTVRFGKTSTSASMSQRKRNA